MNERSSTLFPIVLLVLLAAATFWLNRVVQNDNPKGPARHDPDYIVDNFKIRRFGSDGSLQNTVRADKMTHYPDDDTTLVDTPHVTYHRMPPTEITATRALISRDAKEVDLVDSVRVVRMAAKGGVPTVLDTATLKIFPDDEKGSTRSPVVITQGKSIIKGSGLDIDNKTAISVLHGRVTGTIHRNRTSSP